MIGALGLGVPLSPMASPAVATVVDAQVAQFVARVREARARRAEQVSTPRPRVVAKPAPSRVAPRGRRRRSTTAKRPAAKAGSSDDGPSHQRGIVVNLGPVDLAACGRLARQLVELAVADVLGSQNRSAAGVGSTDGAEEKVS
jgi:hypothetical protein